MDLKIWEGFGRFEWFYKRKGNSMTTIRVYIFGKGFPQATASLATCYNAVEGSSPSKSNNKVRKLDWHPIDVRLPSIGVQHSNNVRTSNGGQPWPVHLLSLTVKKLRCQASYFILRSQNLQYKTHPEFWPSHSPIFKTSLYYKTRLILEKTVYWYSR